MKENQNRNIKRGSSADTGRKAYDGYLHACWIHTRIRSNESVTGYFILPECKCSNCGYVVGFERPKCPHCKAIMDEGSK